MVRKDIHYRNSKMSLVNAIGPINDQLLRSKRLDKGGDFLGPRVRYVHVPEYGTAKFVAGLVHGDCGVFGVGEASVAVSMGEELFDVVFEVLDYGGVGVKLHNLGITNGGELLVQGGLGRFRE